MINNLNIVRLALLAGASISVLNAQAREMLPDQPRTALAEHCLNGLNTIGLQEIQSIREMAKEMSPDVILDRVFSSVTPDFQKALLSKPSAPDKPVKKPEAMRDPRYFLPAIAIMDMPFNWIRVRTNGQVIEPVSADAANHDPDWLRAADELKKKLPVLPAAQRY